MQPKQLFPKFWRRHQEDGDTPEKAILTEAPVNSSRSNPAEATTGFQNDLMSYDDIYHAAGLLSPRSGYGVHKIVEMLNSDRISELSNDVKRASVLMAIEAAGTSPDELLQDANRRQQALNSYEAGQQKQLEDFEARKAQDNTRLQAEVERVTAHYAERIQQNQYQVACAKEALRNWQIARQYESQRISEVIELCSKQPASPVPVPATPAHPQPSLVAKASAGH